MRYVRVQYDAYNRQFNLEDKELSRELEAGGPYVISDLALGDFIPLDQLEGLGSDPQYGDQLNG